MADAIISQVPHSFDKARESGDLLFFPSTTHTVVETGIEYEIRLCPALQKKPNTPAPGLHYDKSKPDPFAPPYIPALVVGELQGEDGEGYVVLLNKYSVVPSHFLLVTKDYRSQASPLLPSDLAQAYSLLMAARKFGQRFFAFYNCGDRSGASQPHKHIQFIPIHENGPPVEELAKSTNVENADKAFSLTVLPYANHVRRLPHFSASTTREALADTLAQAFLSLLDLVISTVRHDPTHPPGAPSYNVILTLEHLHLVPRSQETHLLSETGDVLSINALGFAGMLLVKSETEFEAVRSEGVGKILRDVGLESVHDAQISEAHETDREV